MSGHAETPKKDSLNTILRYVFIGLAIVITFFIIRGYYYSEKEKRSTECKNDQTTTSNNTTTTSVEPKKVKNITFKEGKKTPCEITFNYVDYDFGKEEGKLTADPLWIQFPGKEWEYWDGTSGTIFPKLPMNSVVKFKTGKKTGQSMVYVMEVTWK